MVRFKKLSLDEMRETFTLLSEAEQRAIKGGCSGCDTARGYGYNIYTRDEFFQMVEAGTWTGGYVCGEGMVLGSVTIEGEYGDSDSHGYGKTCLLHNKYYPFNGSCSDCDSVYGGSGYGDGDYGGSYGGNEGGGSFIGGGGGGTSGGDLESTILPKFVKGKEAQNKNFCVIKCIAQAINTYTGVNLDDTNIINECAQVLHEYKVLNDPNYNGNPPLIAYEIKFKGVSSTEIDILYDHFFTNVHILNDGNAAATIDKATHEGDMIFAVWNQTHNVIILDITGTTCTYYDPDKTDGYYKKDLKEFSMLRRVTGLNQ